MTRRYHGLLTAALPAPLGRMHMLSGVNEEIHFADGRIVQLCPRYGDAVEMASPCAARGIPARDGQQMIGPAGGV